MTQEAIQAAVAAFIAQGKCQQVATKAAPRQLTAQ